MLVWHKSKWRTIRADFLKRVVVMAHVRKSKATPSPATEAGQSEMASGEDEAVGASAGGSDQILHYEALKPYAMYFAMIDGLYNVMLKVLYISMHYFLIKLF